MRWRFCSLTALVLAIVSALLHSSPVNGAPIFAEDFESTPAGETLTSNNTVTQVGGAHNGTTGNSAFVTAVFPRPVAAPNVLRVNEDTADLFGQGTANRYLELFDGGTATVFATGPAALTTGDVFQVDFDFYDPSRSEDTAGPRFVIGDVNMTGPGTSVMLSFDLGTLTAFHATESKTTPYNLDQAYHVTVIGSYNPDWKVLYSLGGDEHTVAPGRYDVYIDGELVIDDTLFRGTVTSSSYVRLASASNASLSSTHFDNILIQTIDAQVIPEPGTLSLAGLALGVALRLIIRKKEPSTQAG